MFKLRPFEELVDRGPGRPMWVIAGAVHGPTFVISVNGQRLELTAREVGTDARGPFARVDVGTFKLTDGFEVEFYQEDEDCDASHLHIFKPATPGQELTAALRQQGITPTECNLLIPADQSCSIYFDLDGRRDGGGSNSPRARGPTPAPS